MIPAFRAAVVAVLPSLAAAGAVTPVPVAIPAQPVPSLLWERTVYGSGIGEGGMAVADLDGDGKREIVAFSAQGLYVADFGASEPRVISGPGLSNDTVNVGDLDGDGVPEIVRSNYRSFHVYDGATLSFERNINALTTFDISAVVMADLDGDGMSELVYTEFRWQYPDHTGTLHVIDGATGTHRVGPSCPGPVDLAVGNVDGDPALEIIVASEGRPGLVLDAVTLAVEWTRTAGFGTLVEAADPDGDGRSSIYAAMPAAVERIDVGTQTATGSIAVLAGVQALETGDADGDGSIDVLVAERGSPLIQVFDAATLSPRWTLSGIQPGVNQIVIADIESDSDPDVVWASGSDDVAGRITVAEGSDRSVIWRSPDHGTGPFVVPAVGDLDGDGDVELVYGGGTVTNGWPLTAAQLVYVVDPGSGATVEVVGIGTVGEITALAAADTDGDDRAEIFVGTALGQLLCLDGVTRVVRWSKQPTYDAAIQSINPADLDADGELELHVNVGGKSGSFEENGLMSFRAVDGVLEWGFIDRHGYPNRPVSLGQFDADPALEIVGTKTYPTVFIQDGATGYTQYRGMCARAVHAVDADGDGRSEFLAACGLSVKLYDAAFQHIRDVATVAGTGTIDELIAGDVNRDGHFDVAVRVGSRVTVIDGATQQELWTVSPVMASDSPGAHSFTFEDFDGDSVLELWIATSGLESRLYRFDASYLTASASPFSEGAGAVGVTVALDHALPFPVTVSYATVDGLAAAGEDYGAVSGSLTFAAGATEAGFAVPVYQDAEDEGGEDFLIAFSLPSTDGVGLTSDRLTLTIGNDDGPAVSVFDAGLLEGDDSNWVSVRIRLAAPTTRTTAISVRTRDGTAIAGDDYEALDTVVTFMPDEQEIDIPLLIHGEPTPEADEQFFVEIESVDNPVARRTAKITILDDDGSIGGTPVEAAHGSGFELPLVPPRHVYVLAQPEWASFEVLVDGVSGDLSPLRIDRIDDSGNVLQSVAGSGPSYSLRWQTSQSPDARMRVVVQSGGCNGDCDAADTYRLRVRRTDVAASRFNNAAGQVSALHLQNVTAELVRGDVRFWSGDGTLLLSTPFTLPANAALTLLATDLEELAGMAGSVTIDHDGPYGGLAGGVSVVDPTTGFTYDAPLAWREY